MFATQANKQMLHHKGEERRPVYGNRLCLANAMTAIFCLTINLWVEIHIVNHYSISSSQVQTLASSSCGQQACKYRSVIIECVNYRLSFCYLSTVIGRKKVILNINRNVMIGSNTTKQLCVQVERRKFIYSFL